MKFLPLLVVLVTVLIVAAPASADTGGFHRMFPGSPGFTAYTDADADALADFSVEPQAFNQPDNSTTFVGGQFADHDIDLNRTKLNEIVNINGIDNVRNPLLNLDSVYGGGPAVSPQLYEADGIHLKVGRTESGCPEVPRDPVTGRALLGDPRNDENLVLNQLHAIFLQAHNKLVDQGRSFENAQRALQHTWQKTVLEQWVGRFTGDRTRIPGVNAVLGNLNDPSLAIEFSDSVFRIGHTQPRGAYNLNSNSAARQLFATDADGRPLPEPPARTLLGGRHIPEDACIQWSRFFDDPDNPTPVGQFNAGRRIDSFVSAPLNALPVFPGSPVADDGNRKLLSRTFIRSRNDDLPSYETVARRLGIEPVDVSAVKPDIPAAFRDQTPLLYGVLVESEVTTGGERLGPTGSRIVHEVLRSLVETDRESYLNTPDQSVANTFGGLIKFTRE